MATQTPLSDREMNVILLALGNCVEEKPKVEWAKLTELLGSASVESAKKTYQNAMKKLDGNTGPVSLDGVKGGGKAKATPKKRAASDKAGEGADGEATPAKKKAGRPKKAKAAAAEEAEKVKTEAVEEEV